MCYVSNESKKDIFNGLADELDITVSHYNSGQIKSLVSFISREKTVHELSFLVIDLTDTDFSDEHIISAIQTLKYISAARPIFIAPRSDKTESLFGRLTNFHVTNLITIKPNTDIIKDMRQCLSEDGMVFTEKTTDIQNARATAAKAIIQPLKIPEGFSITICVCGCMNRIGTTTQTFALWHYLNSLGFTPAILNRGDDFLKTLMELYENEVIEYEGHITVNNIPFCFQKDLELWNAYIIDAGVLNQSNRDEFTGADISVLIGGAKPWELQRFAECVQTAEGAKRMAAFMSFTTQKDADELHKVLNMPLHSVPYHPDLWDKGGSTSVYKTALFPYLTELCKQ
jgi:hypothetical protein